MKALKNIKNIKVFEHKKGLVIPSILVSAATLIAVVGGVWFLADKLGITGGQQLNIIEGGATQDEIDSGQAKVDCNDDGITALYVRAEDTEASTLTYVSGTTNNIYAKNTGSNSIQVNGTTDSGGLTNMGDLVCGQEYDLYMTTNAGVLGSAEEKGIVPTGDRLDVTFESNQMSNLNVRIKDINDDAFESGFADGVTTGTNATTFINLNTTNFYEDSSATDFTVGADGQLDLQILFDSATSNKYFGDLRLRTMMCVDLGTDNEWAEPDVSINGQALDEIKGELDSDSLSDSTIAGSEYCYDLDNSLGDSITTVDFFVQAKSGQNPDTSGDDIVITLWPEGTYKSSKEADTIKQGFVTDASTPVGFYDSAEVPKLTLNIQ